MHNLKGTNFQGNWEREGEIIRRLNRKIVNTCLACIYFFKKIKMASWQLFLFMGVFYESFALKCLLCFWF